VDARGPCCGPRSSELTCGHRPGREPRATGLKAQQCRCAPEGRGIIRRPSGGTSGFPAPTHRWFPRSAGHHRLPSRACLRHALEFGHFVRRESGRSFQRRPHVSPNCTAAACRNGGPKMESSATSAATCVSSGSVHEGERGAPQASRRLYLLDSTNFLLQVCTNRPIFF
jgi:hypothetical protein